MCVIDGSIDQFTSTCPMCKVFPPTSARCPHKKEMCRNRKLHPRHDVVYFKNAEVPMFNGCGYCKFAQTNPPANKSGYNNPGWPGCCRPPQAQEYNMIKPAEWLAVSIIHRIDMPADIKAQVDLAFKSVQSPANAGRASPATSPSEKKPNVASSLALPGKPATPSGSPRSSTISIPSLKSRPGGSPQMKPSSLVGAGTSSSRFLNSGIPNTVDQHHQQTGSAPASPPTSRRSGSIDKPMKRIEGFRTTPPGNTRKLSDLDGTSGTTLNPNQHQHQNQSQINSTPGNRTTSQVTVTLTVPALQGKGIAGDEVSRRPSLKHRPSSMSSAHSISKESKESSLRVSSTLKSKNAVSNTTASRITATTNLSDNLKAMSLISTPTSSTLSPSSASSSRSRITSSRSSAASSRSSSPSGSLPDTDPDTSTVTSEGFTDYLSDESDVELQRQAEIRAAQLEQNRVEEEEFKQARQQLTGIGLRPPQEWGDVSVGGVRVGTVPVGITSTPGRYGRRG